MRALLVLTVFVLPDLPVQAATHLHREPDLLHRVVINEVMLSPRAVPAPKGQWFEIWNPHQDPVNLQGMVIRSRAGMHPISPAQSLHLEPGGFLILGPSQTNGEQGMPPIDYAYGGDLPLFPEGDFLEITLGEALVDLASWGSESLPVESGRSLSREPRPEDSLPSPVWCAGRTPYAGGPDLGTPGQPNTWCDNDGDSFAEDEGDCDDADASRHPDAREWCNGQDDNCNGLIDEGPMTPDRVCPTLGVCKDLVARCAGSRGWVCDFPETYEAIETRCDRLDNDCDGETDEGFFWNGRSLGTSCQVPGVCGTGVVVCRSDRTDAVCSTAPDGPNSRASPEVCNHLDDNCNGEIDEDFPVGEACETGIGACRAVGKWVCSPDGWSVHCDAPSFPSSPEICGDGVDNDCNGLVDDGFPVGQNCQVGQGACLSVGKWVCSEEGTGVRCSAIPGSPTPEICGNRLDDDCDGLTDEDDCMKPAGGGGCSARSRGTIPLEFWGLLGAVGLLRRRRPV